MINDGIISKETLFSVNISNMLSGFSKKRCKCQFVESFILVTDFIEPMIQPVSYTHLKYHILKTGDNFYRYKTDIKKWLREMREGEDWLATLPHAEETLDLVDAIERGFDDIEHRIESIDREHSKYVRATVTRLGYLLNREEDMKGLLVDVYKRQQFH